MIRVVYSENSGTSLYSLSLIDRKGERLARASVYKLTPNLVEVSEGQTYLKKYSQKLNSIAEKSKLDGLSLIINQINQENSTQRKPLTVGESTNLALGNLIKNF